MKVIRAEVLGMCFGVRDALKVTETLVEPSQVTIHGQLVHNDTVVNGLATRGFTITDESNRRAIPEGPVVLITAHGISDRERSRLEAAGKRLIDTTCPLVTRAHQAAQKLKADGYFVIVVGRRGHVEVQGMIEDLDRHEVVGSVEEVTTYPSSRLGIVCQTTVPSRLAEQVRQAVVDKNPAAEVQFVDTVCLPTKDHQRSLLRLLDRVDGVVVVGWRHSNNTMELVALCLEHGIPAFHVESADDLDPDWVAGFETVGLTAGTSTLDTTIDEVERALLRLRSAVVAS